MITVKIHKNIIFFILIGLLTILASCEKTQDENIILEEALLNVNLDGLEFESEDDIIANNKLLTEKTISNTHIQYVSNDFHIESQLIPIENNRAQNLKTDLKQNAAAALRELDTNIKYKLLVYNANGGNLVTHRDYVYKQETLESAIKLNTYTEYIFVVVSSRSTSTIPQIENINTLSSARIKDVNADLLYWKSNKMKLTKGQNFLAARLKPKFSEITTTLKMDQTMTGQITAISSPVFKPVVQNISLSLSDGDVTYGSVNNNGKAVSFPELVTGVRSITANSTTLIHNTTTSASLNFGALKVDGETKNNITVSGLSIKPGFRYNLILTLKTCTEAVNGLNGFNWDYAAVTSGRKTGINFRPPGSATTTFKENGEIISFNFNEIGADYGFVYDIMELDNAFNLVINGTPLVGTSTAVGEIQFQNNATSTTQNIEFEDGSQYQTIDDRNVAANKRVKAIWEFKGTVAKPAVRVVIGRNGDVLMYGSKTDQGELFPLRLKNNLQFNQVTWKAGNQTNIINATTRIEGKTTMKSSGSGRKKVSCTN